MNGFQAQKRNEEILICILHAHTAIPSVYIATNITELRGSCATAPNLFRTYEIVERESESEYIFCVYATVWKLNIVLINMMVGWLQFDVSYTTGDGNMRAQHWWKNKIETCHGHRYTYTVQCTQHTDPNVSFTFEFIWIFACVSWEFMKSGLCAVWCELWTMLFIVLVCDISNSWCSLHPLKSIDMTCST